MNSAASDPPGKPEQPYQATIFTAEGQYGSTVFDGEPGYLEINVCDDCLVTEARAGHVVQVIGVVRPPELDYALWEPDDDE